MDLVGKRFLAENGEGDGKLLFLMEAQSNWNSTATPTNMKYQGMNYNECRNGSIKFKNPKIFAKFSLNFKNRINDCTISTDRLVA